jgi:hypothetical protein
MERAGAGDLNRQVATVRSFLALCRRRRWLIDDLTVDLERRRVRIRSKGGDTDWLHFQAGAARLLPRLIGGRTRGPLFLADRRPVPARAPATVDRCPETDRRT